MEVTGQPHAPAALFGSRYPLNGRMGGPQSRIGPFAEELSLLPQEHEDFLTTAVPPSSGLNGEGVVVRITWQSGPPVVKLYSIANIQN
jgi:hypothetical protein